MRLSNPLFSILMAVMLSVVPWPACASSGSIITSHDMDRIYIAITKNKWRDVEQETAMWIQVDIPAQKHLLASLRYIYIASLTAQLDRKELKYADLAKKLSLVTGKLVLQSWHPVNASGDPCLNLVCSVKGNPSMLTTVQANTHSNQVYSYEYFAMSSNLNLGSYNGQSARLGGILDKVEINPDLAHAEKAGPNASWFLRLHFTDGFIQFKK